MIDNLLWHELEVVKSFFAEAIARADEKTQIESARIAKINNPDDDTIASIERDPRGAYEFEQVTLRSVINELNALCEFALQNTWKSFSKQIWLPNGTLVYAAERREIETALAEKNEDVKTWPRWQEVLMIKEMSEGFKHRQRMQPFPKEVASPNPKRRAKERFVEPSNEKDFAYYELTKIQTVEYLAAIEELFHWLDEKYSI